MLRKGNRQAERLVRYDEEKWIWMLLAAAMAALLVMSGCGGRHADRNKITIDIGYENNPGEPLDQALNRWKDLVAEKAAARWKSCCIRPASWAAKTISSI